METERLAEQLALGREGQQRLSQFAVSPGAGPIGSVIATFRARRQANRNAQILDALSEARERQREQIVQAFPEDSRAEAAVLPTGTIRDILGERLKARTKEVQPLSPEGKLQRDIQRGFVRPELAARKPLSEEGKLQADIQSGLVDLGRIGRPLTLREKEREKALGKKEAETVTTFKSMTSKLPELERNVEELKSLSEKATFTYAGRGSDFIKRQLKITTEGGKARKEFEARVNNQILPLLRDTFGAAFTEREGESLRKTLGDPNATPDEKKAILDIFIEQKIRDVKSKAREVGFEVQEEVATDKVTINDPLGIR